LQRPDTHASDAYTHASDAITHHQVPITLGVWQQNRALLKSLKVDDFVKFGSLEGRKHYIVCKPSEVVSGANPPEVVSGAKTLQEWLPVQTLQKWFPAQKPSRSGFRRKNPPEAVSGAKPSRSGFRCEAVDFFRRRFDCAVSELLGANIAGVISIQRI